MKTNTYMNFAKRVMMILAVVLMAGNVWGTDAVITFANTSGGDGTQAYSTSNFVSDGIASSDAAFGTITCSETTRCFKGKNNYGLKLGGSSNAGSFTISFSNALVNVSKITLSRAAYNSDKGKQTTITVKHGSTTLANAVATGSSTSFNDMEIDDLSIASLNSLTVSSGQYCYVKSITITYNPGDAITLNKNNSDASGSANGAGTIAADATTMTIGTAPTRTGYTVEGYYTTSACATKIAAANGALQPDITVDAKTWTNGSRQWKKGGAATFYTKWTAKTYTVTLNDNGATTAGTANVTATYNSASLSSAITNPEKTHYIFNGWYSGVGGTGSKVIDENGVLQANVSGYTGAGGVWTCDEATNLYAKWTEHTYTNYRTKCCTPLAAPANIEVSVTGAATATVTWDAVADATGYEYKLGDGEWTTASVTGTTTKTLSLSGLTGATDYTIYLRANGSGDNCTEGTASAGTNFRTYSTVTAAMNDPLMGTAKVSLNNSDWYDAVETTDGTTIYLQATPGSLYNFSNWATPSSGTINNNQLTGWSGDVTVTANFVAKQLTKLGTPTGMGLVGEPGATSATIKWNKVDHASGYQVICAGATIGDVTVTGGVASCPLTILTANTTYNWTVTALGDGISFEDGDACASQSFTTDKKKPTAIEITHAPTVTEYLEGESFATAGMVVKVTYNNGDIDGAYSDYTIDPSGALEFGTTYVTVTASLNEVSVSTTQAITVHKKYTLTFKNNGSIVETKNLKEGDAYGTFPSAGDACDGTSTTFMGWSTAEISEKQSAAPAEGYASPTDVMGTENVVLNAVWAKEEGHEGYSLVTAPTAGKTYIFVASNTAGSAYALDAKNMNTSTSSGAKSPAKAVTVSSGTPVYVGTVDEDIEFVFSDNKYSIVSLTNQYFYINGNGVSRRSSAQGTWDNDNGLYATSTSGQTTYYLSLDNSDPENVKFYYATSAASANRVYAFEKQEVSYTDYLTTCCDEWSVTASYGEGNVISVSDGAVAVTLSDLAYGTASYESSDEDVLTVASDGKITGKKAGSATVTIAWAGIAGSKCAFETTVDVTVNGPITVTYNANDGSDTPATTSQNATSNTAFTLDANSFSRTGYTFQGWATTPSGAKAYDNSQANVSFAEDVTLYAVWALNSHAVTLTQPTGNTITANSSTTPGNVTYGTTVNLTATENDGYIFTSWSVTGITLADATANPAQFTMPDNAVSVSANYTHYTWDLTGYTVETAPETEYSTGDHFSKASVVIKAGYERSDTKETKQVAVDAANWTAKLNGTEIADNYTFVIGDHGKTLTLWVGDTQVGENYVLTVNAIPTDHFVINIWTSEISPIADKTSAYSMPNLSDQTAGAAATCKDHNLFVGWVEADYKDEPEGHIVAANTAMTPSDKTFYAVWGKTGTITESISYGWETGESTAGWMINGSSVATPVHTGEKAGQFGTAGRAIKTSTSYANPKSITVYYAKNSGNTNNENYFKIQYSTANEDNGTWNDIISGKNFSQMSNGYYEELTADLSSSTYEGKYFRVYFNKASTSGNLDDITLNYNISGPVDYITECVQRYQITFDANGGIGSYDAIEKKEGATVTLPDGSALSRQWHNFDGWKVYNATTDEEIAVTENSFTTPAANVNVVAQWQEVSKAKVVYMNGDDQYSTRPNIHEGEEYSIAGKPEDQEGKLFIGWKNTLTSDTMKVKDPALKVIMPTPAVDIRYDALWLDVLPEPTSSTVDAADLSNGEWVLVTANNQLRTGDIVIVAAKDSPFALGSTQNSSNRASVSITKSEDKQRLSNPDGNVAKLFLQNGIGAGEYALYDYAYVTNETNGGYLYAAGNSSNDLKTKTSLDRDASWTITISNDDAAATIKAKGQYSRNWLRHNKSGSNNLFSCYASGQNDVVLYKWVKKISGSTNLSGIELTDAVIVKNGATLTVDAASSLVDLTVEAGGKVETTNELTVINNLTIESEAGKSGQVSNAGNVHANNVYMDVTFYKTAEILDATSANQWYMISAPFDVNLADGFTLTDGTPMRFAQSGDAGSYIFDLFEYDGAKRASTGNTGWKRVQGHMPAGKACLIGFVSGQPTTIRLKAANATLAEKASIALNAYSGDAQNQNWNGVANPNLHYININKDVQIYNNEEGENGRKYLPYTASSYSFVVGTAFFVQETGSISLSAATNGLLRAPKRESERYEACVRIVRDGTETFADQMFVRASEEASNEYEQGHDMITWNGTTAKTALIWSNNYGKRLAIEEAPMVDDQASYALSLYAPTDGTYRIETPTENEGATLYLTREGRAIWNLSMSACEVELSKGTTENYGLLLVRKAPGVATGMENVQSDNVQCTKVIIDNQVFILRGGQMYDVTGKAVK